MYVCTFEDMYVCFIIHVYLMFYILLVVLSFTWKLYNWVWQYLNQTHSWVLHRYRYLYHTHHTRNIIILSRYFTQCSISSSKA